MGLRFGGLSVAVAGVVLAFAGCHDYDEFEFVEQPGSGGAGAIGGTSGSGGSLGGSGGTIGVGGAGGSITGGTGGVATGGTGGSGGATGGAAGAGGSTGCPTGEKTCNGTCVSTSDPAFGCSGPTCDPCVIPNATTQCAPAPTPPNLPICALQSCNSGFFNCNTDLTDGCEQTIDTTTHCGGCNRACSTTESTAATCTAAKCVHTCNAGFGDCSQPLSPVADNGCETSFNTSTTSCGACGVNCATQGSSGGFVCLTGTCGCSSNAQCNVGGDPADAVCNTANGVCSCSGATCDPGEACVKSGPNSICRCASSGGDCASGQTCCPTGGCKNLQTDPANCGGCGKVCPTGTTCTAGSCV